MRAIRPVSIAASARTVSATPGGVSLAGASPASTPRRRLLAGVASATALALPPALAGLATRPARAQDAFPTKPLRCVVAFPAGGVLEVRAGQAVVAKPGEWVRYSSPEAEGAEYVAVCLPAFSPDTVHRDA